MKRPAVIAGDRLLTRAAQSSSGTSVASSTKSRPSAVSAAVAPRRDRRRPEEQRASAAAAAAALGPAARSGPTTRPAAMAAASDPGSRAARTRPVRGVTRPSSSPVSVDRRRAHHQGRPVARLSQRCPSPCRRCPCRSSRAAARSGGSVACSCSSRLRWSRDEPARRDAAHGDEEVALAAARDVGHALAAHAEGRAGRGAFGHLDRLRRLRCRAP